MSADGPHDRWWHVLLTFVPRETYLKATRVAADAQSAYCDEKDKADYLDSLMRTQKDYIHSLEAARQAEVAETVQVRVALNRVAEYADGIAMTQPLPLLVDGLARDHEELESRIEAVLDLILVRRDINHLAHDSPEYDTLNRIAGLLQGQIDRVPNTPEGLQP